MVSDATHVNKGIMLLKICQVVEGWWSFVVGRNPNKDTYLVKGEF